MARDKRHRRYSRQSPARVHVDQRRALVAELRERGFSYAVIADAVRARFPDTCPASYNQRYAYQDVRYILDQAAEVTIKAKAPLRALANARLERLHAAFYDLALKGDNDAFTKVFRVLEREAKMWGLDAEQAGTANMLPLPEHHRRCLLLLRVGQELLRELAPDEPTYLVWLGLYQQRLEAMAGSIGLPTSEPPALPEP